MVTPPAVIQGKDAVIFAKYGDSSAPVELTRGSNSFNLDGLNVTVSGTFNETGVYDKAEEVTFDAKTDTDKIIKAVTDMIKDYNDIIKLVNSEVSTKPNRKYEPLTDQQKEQMKDSQIEKWETEAKKGLLFNDPELRNLSDSLRFVFFRLVLRTKESWSLLEYPQAKIIQSREALCLTRQNLEQL